MEKVQEKVLRFSGYLLAIQMAFEEKLQAKTGWGRNEIMLAYKEAVAETLAKFMDGYVK